AARIACAAGAEPWLPRFVRAVYRANFAEDRDIADAHVLGAILTELDQAPEPILAAAQTPESKQRLRLQTDEASRRGIVGAPTCTVGAELFWGNDRIEAAIAWRRRL